MVLCLDAANPKNYNLTEVEYLIVAGGGSGGIGEANPAGDGAGGGGGGGVLTNVGRTSLSISPNQSYTIVVGNGGSNGTGSNSSAFGLTAIGGGRGGDVRNGGVTSGGSGGGAGGNCNDVSQGPRTGGAGTAGQGNRGGNDLATGCSLRGGRGGGGAGFAAADAALSEGTSGGDGVISYISGTGIYYGGGGGGGRGSSSGVGGAGGLGGGGSGSNGTVSAVAGTNNTGGGGGGGASAGSGSPQLNGANGGSGIVIIRYQGPQKAIGGTVTSNGEYTIHTFTTVGSNTFTPLVATNNSVISGLSDFSGRGNFGTSVNGPSYSSANGGSIVFDGTDDYISFNSTTQSLGLTSSNGATLSCWLKITLLSRWTGVFTFWGPAGNVDFGWDISPTNNLRMWKSGGAIETSSLSAYSNVWCNYVLVSNSTGTIFYINGTQFATSSITGNVSFTNGRVLWFGDHWDNPIQGSSSSIQIYNKALTAAEIQQNFNATRGRFGI